MADLAFTQQQLAKNNVQVAEAEQKLDAATKTVVSLRDKTVEADRAAAANPNDPALQQAARDSRNEYRNYLRNDFAAAETEVFEAKETQKFNQQKVNELTAANAPQSATRPADGDSASNSINQDIPPEQQNAEPITEEERQRIENPQQATAGEDVVTGRNVSQEDVTAEEQEKASIQNGTDVVGPVSESSAAKEPDPEPSPANQQSTQSASRSTNDGSDAATGKSAAEYTPLTNPLHDYPSYTYNLSLHVLSPDDYNQILENQTFVPSKVLIASAGRHNSSASSGDIFPRASRFKEDFYFDGLTMTTFIKPTEKNRNTNAVTIDFKLIEPYGFTLLERLILTAKDLKEPNYLKLPYLLQIDFFAYGNDGTLIGKLHDLTKYIPISINTLDVNLTNQGAEYSLTCTPFNHSVFNHTYAKTPINLEVKAKTVNSFFGSEPLSSESQRQIQNDAEFGRSRGANRNVNGSISGDRPAFSGEVNVTSYAAALNGHMEALKNLNKIKVADVYKFVIDPEIADAAITFESKVNHLDTGFTDIDDPQQVSKMASGNLGQAVGLFDPTRQIYAINAGTTIERVLDYTIRNSDYILKQLVIPESYDSAEAYKKALEANGGFLNWYKITTKVKLLEYDTIRNVYGKEITYYVNKYTIKNVPLDIAPRGIETNPVKVYNYFYTGKNSDVLSCDIKFETLYYNAQTTYRAALTKTNPLPDPELNTQEENPDGYSGSSDPNSLNISELTPKEKHPTVMDAKSRPTGSAINATQVAATEVERHVLSSYAGDMVAIDLGIIGDPHYIKQDDIFYNAAAMAAGRQTETGADQRLTANGSLITDKGVVYVAVNFQVPIDINESTGLMQFQSEQFQRGIFSGIYMVIMVESTFKDGVFKQTLSLTRAFNQQETIRKSIESADSSSNRQSDINSSNALATPPEAVQDSAPPPPVIEADGGTTVAADQPPSDAALLDGETGTPPATTNETGETVAGDAVDADSAERNRLREVGENAPQQNITEATEPEVTPPFEDSLDRQRQINDRYVDRVNSTEAEVNDLVRQRDSNFDEYQNLSTRLRNEEEKLIRQDPANADLDEFELAQKYPEYGQVFGQRQNLGKTLTSQNETIVAKANSLINQDPQDRPTVNLTIDFNQSVKGPSPTIRR